MERLASLKRVTPTGVDYWLAREILAVLGYARWENFQEAIRRAMSACEGVGANPATHFRETTKMVEVGSGAMRRVPDFFLSRTACYLIAMNGEPSKPEIAAAQAYFTVQTRRMEQRDESDSRLAHEGRRIELRDRYRESFKGVSGVAQRAGVPNKSQPFFHGARYRGLYGMSLKHVKSRKKLGEKDNLIDRAGPMELSMHNFQMELAAQVLTREGIRGERLAINRNEEVAQRVRQVMEESGGALPEDLPLEPPIKEIEARHKKAKRLEGATLPSDDEPPPSR